MTIQSIFMAELIGTAMLVTLGDGVVANVVLDKTKGNKSGWLMIATGWGLAVALSVYAVGRVSGAHINPAVTVGLAVLGEVSLDLVPVYIVAQMLGALLGGIIVWLLYLPHWDQDNTPAERLGVFCCAPAIRRPACNLLTEMIATAVLVFGVLAIGANASVVGTTEVDLAAAFNNGFKPLLVGLLVWSIGMSLGGPTGYAINPARDIGPRIAHAILPIPHKQGSDWSYAFVTILGPLAGGVIGALAFATMSAMLVS